MSKLFKKRKKLKILFVLFIIFSLLIVYLTKVVNPLIITTNKAGITQITADCINEAVSSSLNDNLYNDLISIEKDNNNKITLISCNSNNVNKLSNNISVQCQQYLKDICNKGYDISLLSFTGLTFLNGIGPKVNIKTVPIGNIKTSYKSSFTTSGINQTLHQLYINIVAQVNIVLPLHSTSIECSSQVLIAESLIVGEIPNVYLSGNLLSNKLNLVP